MTIQTERQVLKRKMSFDPAYIQKFEEKMFIEGPTSARRLTNFFTLLLLATFIATYGLLSSSTATIIGAMIVAPLMGPIMATTAAVVMGHSRRALRSLGLALVGILAVIACSYVLALIVPNFAISFTANPELASRINPGLYALLTALGSGAAGAFITSRDEIADSMGGVAIAISLVPPLCVVGIAMQMSNWAAAGGALLLFMTNFLAILLAGGLTFLIVGLGQVATTQAQISLRRRGFVLFFIGTLLVAVPLTLTASRALRDVADTNTAAAVIHQWLQGSAYQELSVDVENQLVIASIEGSGDLKPAQTLAERLAAALGHPIIVHLRMVPTESASSP